MEVRGAHCSRRCWIRTRHMLRKDPPGGVGSVAAARVKPPDRSNTGGGGGSGRRPLLSTFEGNNRQMLIDIKDSLNHVVKKNPTGADVGQLDKSELSQSTPNLLDSNKINGNNSNGTPVTQQPQNEPLSVQSDGYGRNSEIPRKIRGP